MLDSDRIDRIARKHNGLKTEVTKRVRVVQSELMAIDEKLSALPDKLHEIENRIDQQNMLLDKIVNCLKGVFMLGVINLITVVMYG